MTPQQDRMVFTLTQAELSAIFAGLGELPAKVSIATIDSLRGQTSKAAEEAAMPAPQIATAPLTTVTPATPKLHYPPGVRAVVVKAEVEQPTGHSPLGYGCTDLDC